MCRSVGEDAAPSECSGRNLVATPWLKRAPGNEPDLRRVPIVVSQQSAESFVTLDLAIDTSDVRLRLN
jgi:hypothetical protein